MPQQQVVYKYNADRGWTVVEVICLFIHPGIYLFYLFILNML